MFIPHKRNTVWLPIWSASRQSLRMSAASANLQSVQGLLMSLGYLGDCHVTIQYSYCTHYCMILVKRWHNGNLLFGFEPNSWWFGCWGIPPHAWIVMVNSLLILAARHVSHMRRPATWICHSLLPQYLKKDTTVWLKLLSSNYSVLQGDV